MKLPVFSTRLRFTRDVAGGNPVSTNLIADYIAAMHAGQSNPLKAALATDGVVTDEAEQKFLEKCTGLHYRDKENGRAYICDYMVQANLRAAAIALNIRGAKTGALHNVLTHGLLLPARIYLSDDKDTEFITRAIQPFDKGYRQPSLATFEIIPAGSEMEFTIAVADEKELTKDRLKLLLNWGGNIGLGAKRALGYGKYEVLSLTNGRAVDVSSLSRHIDESQSPIAAVGN